MRWEPLYEVTQMKGDGEAHPSLSPNDEFANFERWDKGSFGRAKTPDMLPREYAREAFKRGLAYEQQLGANPFKFGLVGRTDSHTSLATTDGGQLLRQDRRRSSRRRSDPLRGENHRVPAGSEGKDYSIRHYQASPPAWPPYGRRTTRARHSGTPWQRKEVYATTGTRMIVRVFAGWDFTADEVDRADFAEHGYQRGVPMGGDLVSAPTGKAPTFLIRAAARSGRRQPRPHPDHQGLARR